jgi:hypothetical protein
MLRAFQKILTAESQWDGPLSKRLRYASIFLIVCASKLLLIRRFTTPNPFWDAGDVEEDWLYKPFLTRALRLLDLFASVNEHRFGCLGLLILGLQQMLFWSRSGEHHDTPRAWLAWRDRVCYASTRNVL